MGGKAGNLAAFEKILKFGFKDKSLLTAALTHSSSQTKQRFDGDDNERLEFLGDRVLGLSISSQLFLVFPDINEGEMARRYNRLVRGKMCAVVAISLSLGDYIVVSAGEERSGGRTKSTILADAMEAVLGAVFLDGGYDGADALIKRLWGEHLLIGEEVKLDPKTALQEWAQGKGFDLPSYRQVGRSGPDHQPIFETEVNVEGVGKGKGFGASKQIAEQTAAQDLLEKQQVWDKLT